MGHQNYVLVLSETTVSKKPVVFFCAKYQRLSKVVIIQMLSVTYLKKMNMGKILFGYHDASKIYGAPKLCTETTISNPSVIFPKTSWDIQTFRSP